MAESFGVEDRGRFYDPVGALRDVVVNHLMRVVAATAMEPPASDNATTLSNADGIGFFKAMPAGDPIHYVRGQYGGYHDIDGVAAASTTEIYAALRLGVDNWRWSGVPIVNPHRKASADHAERGASRRQRPCHKRSRRTNLVHPVRAMWPARLPSYGGTCDSAGIGRMSRTASTQQARTPRSSPSIRRRARRA